MNSSEYKRVPKKYTAIYSDSVKLDCKKRIDYSNQIFSFSVNNKPLNHDSPDQKYDFIPCDKYYILTFENNILNSFLDLATKIYNKEQEERNKNQCENKKNVEDEEGENESLEQFKLNSLELFLKKKLTTILTEEAESIDDRTFYKGIRIGSVVTTNLIRNFALITLEIPEDLGEGQAESNPETQIFNSFSTFTNIDIREKFLNSLYAEITYENESLILNVIPSFYQEKNYYQGDKIENKPLKRIRYFIPDECTIQLTPEGLDELKCSISSLSKARDKNSKVDIIQAPKRDNLNTAFQALLKCKLSIVCKQKTPGYFTVDITNSSEWHGLFECLRYLNQLPQVEFAEPAEIATGKTSIVADLITHHNVDVLIESHEIIPSWGLQALRMSEAWGFHRGKSKVNIAVIDQLVQPLCLEKLSNPIELYFPIYNNSKLSLYDFCSNQDALKPTFNHGDHMVALICGVDKDMGFIGIAPKCNIMSLGVNLDYGQISCRVDAIHYIVSLAQCNKNERYVINCSWCITGENQALLNAIYQASQQSNVCLVTAAGNFPKTQDNKNDEQKNIDKYPIYPACSDVKPPPTYKNKPPENNAKYVITVGSSTINGHIWEMSGIGEKNLDVCAPGVDIFRPADRIVLPNKEKTSYELGNGTSLSSAFTAGIIALIWSVAPELSPSDIKNILIESCDDFPYNPEYDSPIVEEHGPGVINAGQAIVNSLARLPKSLHLFPGFIFFRFSFLMVKFFRTAYVLIFYGIYLRTRPLNILIHRLFRAIGSKNR